MADYLMEHRRGNRFSTRVSADLYLRGGRLGAAKVINFSRGGMYLQTRRKNLRPFQKIFIHLPRAEKGIDPLKVSADVVRGDGKGIGVLINDSDGRAQEVLTLLAKCQDPVR